MLHRARLDDGEIEQRHGFSVTRVIRAVAELAALGQAEFVEQALREGTKRGVITRQQVLELRQRGGHPEWFDRLLERHSR